VSEFPVQMLRDLKPNWDSYGAGPIDERCIQKAYELWRCLSGRWDVVPTNNGGVQLEQHRDWLDIEILVEICMSPPPTERPAPKV
jgi:hypothetical protein